MKATRIGVMVLGIVVLMFVITPYVSAQAIEGVWFKGKASLKGYEITNRVRGTIVEKTSGSGTIYVNIIDGANLPEPDTDANHYYVTTCIEDPDVDGVWHLGRQIEIFKGFIYSDPDNDRVSIWDFAADDDTDMRFNFYTNIVTNSMFYVKVNGSGTKSNFSSFACMLYDDSEPPARQLGSCSISFATVDSLKVPRGATGCIVTAP